MFEHLIGKQSQKVINEVERGAVKQFAEAIGDPHPIYVDRSFGEKSNYKTNIAPPTFPQTFDYGNIKALKLPKAGLIHGEQSFEYQRPITVGETLQCYSEIYDYKEKHTKSGKLGFLSIQNIGEDQSGIEVFHTKSVIIITEAVRGGS